MIRGKSLEITQQLKPESARIIAQWIGSATVVYNQKTVDAKADYLDWKANGGERPALNQKASHIAERDGLEFLKPIPTEIKRNAASKWFEAMQAALKGLRRSPRVRGKNKKRNCYVTNELFDVRRRDDTRCYIHLKRSARKSDRGRYFASFVMPFPAAQAAKAFYLSRKGRRFWLSMAYEDTNEQPTQREIADTLRTLPRADLEPLVVGFDMGVARQVTASDGRVYHPDDKEIARLAELERKRVKHQRRYSRIARANDRVAGSKKRKRTKGEQRQRSTIARVAVKVAAIKFNRSHHVSKAIAETAPTVAAFEDIHLQNLTRRPKAKRCEQTGQWLPNQARAKAGLNKAILGMNLGQLRDMIAYKLEDRGKLLVKVKAAYSSQECRQCGHTEKANRPTQAHFECVSCGHMENADLNAAGVIRARGIDLVLSGTLAKARPGKTLKVRKKPAREMASLGNGGDCKPGIVPAATDDVTHILTPEPVT